MLTIPLKAHVSIPLYTQIYEYIKSEIQNGHLGCHTRLPSTRALSAHLGVSRNTVETAYSQLLSEGYVETRPKSGCYVCQITGMAALVPSTEPALSGRGPGKPEYEIDFSPFGIDLSHFPYPTWRRLQRNCMNENNQIFLLGHNQGDEPLRTAICSYLRQSRSVNCTREQIIVGAGVDYLLQLLAGLFPKDTLIAMENPGYLRAFQIFKGLGFSIRPLPMDKKGLCVDSLESSSSSLAYVTPSHQYPLGTVMPISRRMELLQWAWALKGRYIIEDDHDSEFRYKGKPIPSLQGIDSQNRIIYIGTFSRAIAPAIRIGYMVLPPELLKRYQKNFHYYSSTVSRIEQAIVTEFIEKGYFERHLNRMRKLYKAKHDCMLDALGILKDSVEVLGENAGLHLVIRLFTRETESHIISAAKKAGLRLYGLSPYYLLPPPEKSPAFLMGFGNLTEEEITKGIYRLYQIFTGLF